MPENEVSPKAQASAREQSHACNALLIGPEPRVAKPGPLGRHRKVLLGSLACKLSVPRGVGGMSRLLLGPPELLIMPICGAVCER